MASSLTGKSVVLATGTFLRGCINIGLAVRPAGRMGDGPAVGLAKTLDALGFQLSRLKTGTPPRLLASTVNFDQLEKQVQGMKFCTSNFIICKLNRD